MTDSTYRDPPTADDDIIEVIAAIGLTAAALAHAEDNGEQSTEGFWQAVGTGWAEADPETLRAIRSKIAAEEKAESEQRISDRETNPWIVTIYGPGDASSFESTHATAPDAPTLLDPQPNEDE